MSKNDCCKVNFEAHNEHNCIRLVLVDKKNNIIMYTTVSYYTATTKWFRRASLKERIDIAKCELMDRREAILYASQPMCDPVYCK